MVITVAAFISVISVLVFFHELGHFVVARWYGVRVITFSVGFGPKLLRLQGGATEYCLSAIPLGGYVRMATGQPEHANADEYYARTKWQRTQIMAAGPAMNFLLAIVALTGIALHGFDVPSGVGGHAMTHFQPSLSQALMMGVQATAALCAQVVTSLHGLVSGGTSLRDMAGPIGIAQLAGTAARHGWIDLLALTTMLSLNLGLMNLLPLPTLDGGHMALIAIERVRGRDFAMSTRRRILAVGFGVLLVAMAATIYNDVSRIGRDSSPAGAPTAATRPAGA